MIGTTASIMSNGVPSLRAPWSSRWTFSVPLFMSARTSARSAADTVDSQLRPTISPAS